MRYSHSGDYCCTLLVPGIFNQVLLYMVRTLDSTDAVCTEGGRPPIVISYLVRRVIPNYKQYTKYLVYLYRICPISHTYNWYHAVLMKRKDDSARNE